MNLSQRVWVRLALAVAVVGVGFLLLAVVGQLLGWNRLGGLRYGSNVVPFSLFAGFACLLLGGGIVLSRAPEALPRSRAFPAILVLAVLSFAFVAAELRYMKPLILLPVDLVMGSESQFVDHIIRYRAGQPQYTPIDDANSSAYAPGAPLLTYWIASLVGRPTSIAAYRLIQQIYILVAVLFGLLAARSLFLSICPESKSANLWMLMWIPFLYLIATNPFTNVYAFTLYSDGLGLAANGIAFWLLIKHLTTEDDRWLIPMAIIPALGFLAKQKEVLWIGLYVVYFLLSGRVSLRRVLCFALGSTVLAGAVVGLCYVLWGAPFWAWNFQVLSHLHVSLRRVLDQLTSGAWFVLPGFIGGALLLSGKGLSRLLPAWICWVLHILASLYTSGIAFRPAHLGAATLEGTVWFLVGLATLWSEEDETQTAQSHAFRWWCAAMVPLGVLCSMLGADLLRAGSAVPGDFASYIAAIEKEFTGVPRDKVLLDTGSWIYLPTNSVMMDRESPIGTLSGTGSSDLSGTVKRLRQRYYMRILVRREMTFDRHPSLRQALAENYREVRVIPVPQEAWKVWMHRFLLHEVRVLEPIPPGSVPAERASTAPRPAKRID